MRNATELSQEYKETTGLGPNLVSALCHSLGPLLPASMHNTKVYEEQFGEKYVTQNWNSWENIRNRQMSKTQLR